ncbi:MAG: IS21 family transposase [Candidatus Ornithospirochaeta sp.]
MKNNTKGDDVSIALVIKEMEDEGVLYKANGKPNVPELMERAGLSRQRARRIASNGFKLLPHGNTGTVHAIALSADEVAEMDSLLSRGVTNSNVILRVLREKFGYEGSKSSLDRCKEKHSHLIPAPREIVAEQGVRVRRYETDSGEMYQMDWGFVNVRCVDGSTVKVALFAMVCHHCGMLFVEFFPNSRQQNLFIGMVHSFIYMGMPETVLTDNMASVSNRRDPLGKPIMNATYDSFQKACGFKTRLCKPRHPYTKGKVERLIEFVKSNFIPAREFVNITDLNGQVATWCDDWNSRFHRSTGKTPATEHRAEPVRTADGDETLQHTFMEYLAPLRTISIDGFVCLDGRRYGVPFSYHKKKARVMRDKDLLIVLDDSCSYEVVSHKVDWSYNLHYCNGQFLDDEGPEEHPTAKVKAYMTQIEEKAEASLFSEFDFAFPEEGGNG